MRSNGVVGGLRPVWLLSCSILAVITFLPSASNAEMIGDHLWNLRENSEGFFGSNVPYVRPWRTTVDDGWGEFVGPAPYGLDFGWGLTGTTGNSLDGSLLLDRGVDLQFSVWTFLYVPTPTTISLSGQGDCVPRWFLNYAFDSPQQFPLGGAATINLSAGWNRLDITGYNQVSDFLFESSALATQVAIMNTSPVPEPCTIHALTLLLAAGGLVCSIRNWRVLAGFCRSRLG